MNHKKRLLTFIILEIFLIFTVSAVSNSKFDEKNRNLFIINPDENKDIISIQKVSIKSDLTKTEEIYKITSYENYTFNKDKDFILLFQKIKGKNAIRKIQLEILENIEYETEAPVIIEVEKNLTISNIVSIIDATHKYDTDSRNQDWGTEHSKYKWIIKTSKGTVRIGFDQYEIISTNPLNIIFSRIVTEQIGSNKEPKYRNEWRPFSPDGKTIKKGESYLVKMTARKKAETGDFSYRTTPVFAGVEDHGATWWNGSWKYRIDNPIPDGPRPYQLSLNISNSNGINNATHVFLNGKANPDFSDIRFTLDNTTNLSYWIEDRTTGKIWVNVAGNGVLNLYYGNPSASSVSDGESTFEFFEDFSNADIGSNPVLSPSQPWELTGNLRWGSIVYKNGLYYMYYTNGAEATSDIGEATSTDLINWNKNPNNPVISDRIGPSLLKEMDGKTPVLYDNKYWMLTMKSNGEAIELRSAPSLDSNTWTLEIGNLINPVSGSWYDNYVFTTSFVKENDVYYIIMEGRDNGLKWNIGYFTASSPGGPYTDKNILITPTFSWEETGVLDPVMRKFGNTYYLFYTGGINKPTYNNSFATSMNPEGGFTKSQIQVTPLTQTYPEILNDNGYYYILTDDHTPASGRGKNLYKRKDLNGIFGSPFEWYKGGSPTASGSELLIDHDGEYIRSTRAFLYKALKIRAKFAPLSEDNSYQYIGFAASTSPAVANSEMISSYETSPNMKAWSGNAAISENTAINDTNYFGSYHNYEILWRNSEAKFIIDDTLKAVQTASIADTPQPIGIYNYATNASLYVDWVFVRNYVSPEPAWSIWTAEDLLVNDSGNNVIDNEVNKGKKKENKENRKNSIKKAT